MLLPIIFRLNRVKYHLASRIYHPSSVYPMTGPHNQPPTPFHPSLPIPRLSLPWRSGTTINNQHPREQRGGAGERERRRRRKGWETGEGERESERGEEREDEKEEEEGEEVVEEEEEERRTVFSSSTPRGARDADGGYGGKMCVPGYSGSSWESSFDSQCLEIIRGRGGPGVATATANQRAKKNFSFYIAHFSLLAPRKGARGRVRGVARSLARCGSLPRGLPSRHPPRKIMYAKTRWNARIYPRASVCRTVHVYVHASVSVAGTSTPNTQESRSHLTPRALLSSSRYAPRYEPMQRSRCSSSLVPTQFLRIFSADGHDLPPFFLLFLAFFLPVALLLSSIVALQREKER